MTDEVLERLDRLISILQIAFVEQLTAARARLREDDLAAYLLDSSEDWVSSRELVASAVESTGMAERSAFRRLADLRESGVLVSRGSGRNIEYKRSGVL